MDSATVTATVDDNLLSLVSAASAEHVPVGHASFVRHAGRIGVDSALHLATSANWQQPVTVTVEMYLPGEPHPELSPEWELDATGVFPQLTKDQLSLRSDAYENFMFPFTPEVGDYRFEAWVTGREENRTAMEQWEDQQFGKGGAALPWDEASKTVPECSERWIVRFTPVTSA